MLDKLNDKNKKLISSLNQLCRDGVVDYPIDYEAYEPSDEELTETLGYWFGGSKWQSEGDSFVQFGQDGTGSLFLLWFYRGIVNDPPVVFMGSEGEAHFMAPNIESFIKQVGSGKLFCDGDWLNPGKEEKDELDWATLKLRVEELVGPITKDPDVIKNEGISSCPNFPNWVESKVE